MILLKEESSTGFISVQEHLKSENTSTQTFGAINVTKISPQTRLDINKAIQIFTHMFLYPVQSNLLGIQS